MRPNVFRLPHMCLLKKYMRRRKANHLEVRPHLVLHRKKVPRRREAMTDPTWWTPITKSSKTTRTKKRANKEPASMTQHRALGLLLLIVISVFRILTSFADGSN